jgi:hypothetical protein
MFQQGWAPTGWTRLTTFDDYALRVTSGVVGSNATGSSMSNLKTSSASWPITVSPSPGAAATVNASTIGVDTHSHSYPQTLAQPLNRSTVYSPSNPYPTSTAFMSYLIYDRQTSSIAGSSTGHTHPFTIGTTSYTATLPIQNFSISYIDVILASKNL